MSILSRYRLMGCATDADVLALASTHGPVALAEAHAALRENSEGNMVRILKISPAAARMFQAHFGSLAFAAAKACVIVSGSPKDLATDDGSKLDYNIWSLIGELDQFGGFLGDDANTTDDYVRDFKKFLSTGRNAKRIAAMGMKSWSEFEGILQAYRKSLELTKGTVVVDLGHGWKWMDLGSHCSEIEQDMMQHCGHDSRGTMYSLRDQNNHPHVTLTMDDRKIVHQIRGKNNATPDRRYWWAIKAFMDRLHADLDMPKDGPVDGVTDELDAYLYSESVALREAGRQNSVALVVVGNGPPGRKTCALVRSLSKDRSRLIVVSQSTGMQPGSFERMLRASLPDCEKRLRVMEAQGRLVDMIASAERNKHFSPKQALEVFCDSRLAQPYGHDSTELGLTFDPGLVSVRPINVPVDDSDAILSAIRGQDQSAQHRVLDPHIFSNPAGLAQFKSAALGQASESLMREFLADISSDREDAISTLRDMLAAHFDVDSLSYLGSGRNGSAYRHPDGFVLKVTTDPIEVASARRLVGSSPRHLGRVFGIKQLSARVWLLVQEDLDRLSDDDREEFDLSMEVIEGQGAMDALNCGDLARVVEVLAHAPPPARGSIEMAISVMRRFGVPGMCSDMRSLGLTGDFHSGNVMLRGDRPVLIDLGTPGDAPGTGPIREFGSGAPGSGAAGPATMRGSNSSSWSNGRGALKSPANHVPEDENADEQDHALDWGPGRVSGASF